MHTWYFFSYHHVISQTPFFLKAPCITCITVFSLSVPQGPNSLWSTLTNSANNSWNSLMSFTSGWGGPQASTGAETTTTDSAPPRTLQVLDSSFIHNLWKEIACIHHIHNKISLNVPVHLYAIWIIMLDCGREIFDFLLIQCVRIMLNWCFSTVTN